MVTKYGAWLDKVVFMVLLMPMFLLGIILATILFGSTSFGYFAFLLAWWIANTYVISKICWKDGGVLLLRMITFSYLTWRPWPLCF